LGSEANKVNINPDALDSKKKKKMDPLEWYLRTTGLEMWTYTASGVALTCRPGDREMHGILAAHGSF
jgi:hypothetical protein